MLGPQKYLLHAFSDNTVVVAKAVSLNRRPKQNGSGQLRLRVFSKDIDIYFGYTKVRCCSRKVSRLEGKNEICDQFSRYQTGIPVGKSKSPTKFI